MHPGYYIALWDTEPRLSAIYIVSCVGTTLTPHPHRFWHHCDTQCDFQCWPEILFHTDLCYSAFDFTYKLKDGSDSSEVDYGVDGYLFEPTRSDDDTAGHVSRDGDSSDSEEAGVVVAWTPTPSCHWSQFYRWFGNEDCYLKTLKF